MCQVNLPGNPYLSLGQKLNRTLNQNFNQCSDDPGQWWQDAKQDQRSDSVRKRLFLDRRNAISIYEKVNF